MPFALLSTSIRDALIVFELLELSNEIDEIDELFSVIAPDVSISPINPLTGIDVFVELITLFESNPSNSDIFDKDKKYCLGKFEIELKYPAVLSNVILPPLEKAFSIANGATV